MGPELAPARGSIAPSLAPPRDHVTSLSSVAAGRAPIGSLGRQQPQARDICLGDCRKK